MLFAIGLVANIEAQNTSNIVPTVTSSMGDVGGRFFGTVPDPTKTRHYYIAAEPQLWDYAPFGSDVVCGKALPPPLLQGRNGGKYRYIQYRDEAFQARVREDPRLGILGPVLRGVTGEFLAVTFLNRTDRPLSMHPHGVKYDKDSEGALYQPKPGRGAAVAPGAKFTYIWQLDENSGPLPGEPSSKGWLYHSHVAGDEETDLGLIGFIVVNDPRRARPDGTPSDVDREMAALFMIFDESGLGQDEKEAAEYGLKAKPWAQVQEQLERGRRYAINGRVFGNLSGLEMNEGERVRWYLFALGSEPDLHTAHWHGLRVVEEGRRRTDVVELLPASMKVADMVADNPGTWLFHCHVAEHMMEGMFAHMIVHPKGATNLNAAAPFFGLKPAERSLQIDRAQATLSSNSAAAASCEVQLEGSVTVFDAFSVFVVPVQFQLGGKTTSFNPDRRGVAKNSGDSFRVKNANEFGVVFGGTMEFEVKLSGPDWLRELKQASGPEKSVGAREITLPLVVQIGSARHVATVRIQAQTR